MKRKIFLSAILILSILSVLFLTACGGKNNNDGNDATEKKEPPVEYIKAVGTEFKLGSETIKLRGVNAGGYLLQEEWMCPTDMTDELSLIKTLNDRFGESGASELLEVYRQNFWTDKDFDNIKDLGFNLIRLPLIYTDFYDSEFKFKQYGFDLLNTFIEKAKERGLYVLPDLHGAPGSQNGRDHSGDTSQSSLFSSRENMQRTVDLWVEIAKRFKDEAYLAGYDLLNEPEGGLRQGTTGFVQWSFYDRLYKAIREIDNNHIIFMESVWEAKNLPQPSLFNFENVAYEYHYYAWDAINDTQKTISFIDKKLQDLKDANHGVPVFIGEFTAFADVASWEYMLNAFNDNGFGYAVWTYKVSGLGSTWGLYTANTEKVKPETDDFETIKSKWSQVKTENYTENTFITNIFKKLNKI